MFCTSTACLHDSIWVHLVPRQNLLAKYTRGCLLVCYATVSKSGHLMWYSRQFYHWQEVLAVATEAVKGFLHLRASCMFSWRLFRLLLPTADQDSQCCRESLRTLMRGRPGGGPITARLRWNCFTSSPKLTIPFSIVIECISIIP